MPYYSQEELEGMGFKHIGENVRISTKACIYQPERLSIGDHSRIDDFCVVLGDIQIGSYTHIAIFSHLGGGDEGIVIGDFVDLAYRSTVITHSVDYSLETLNGAALPKGMPGGDSGPVTIGDYSIIGYSTLVMPGVNIEVGTSIGAFSLVKNSTESWGLYAGVPARRIRDNDKGCIEIARRIRNSNEGMDTHK